MLLGKNGMGKSTLLKTVMGFLPKLGGSVKLFGEEISGTGATPHRAQGHRVHAAGTGAVPGSDASRRICGSRCAMTSC